MCDCNAGWADVSLSISYNPWNAFLGCGRPLLLYLSLLGLIWLDDVLLVLMEQVEHGVDSRHRCRKLFESLVRTSERIASSCWCWLLLIMFVHICEERAGFFLILARSIST